LLSLSRLRLYSDLTELSWMLATMAVHDQFHAKLAAVNGDSQASTDQIRRSCGVHAVRTSALPSRLPTPVVQVPPSLELLEFRNGLLHCLVFPICSAPRCDSFHTPRAGWWVRDASSSFQGPLELRTKKPLVRKDRNEYTWSRI